MPELETIKAKHVFDADEKAAIAMRLANTQVELDDAKDERKAIGSQYKAKIDSAAANVRVLSNKLRDFDCLVRFDFEAGEKHYIDPATGEVRKSEPITDMDRQTRMEVPDGAA